MKKLQEFFLTIFTGLLFFFTVLTMVRKGNTQNAPLAKVSSSSYPKSKKQGWTDFTMSKSVWKRDVRNVMTRGHLHQYCHLQVLWPLCAQWFPCLHLQGPHYLPQSFLLSFNESSPIIFISSKPSDLSNFSIKLKFVLQMPYHQVQICSTWGITGQSVKTQVLGQGKWLDSESQQIHKIMD